MGSIEGNASPEFRQAVQEYQNNLHSVWERYGFSGLVLKEIDAKGAIPALVFSSDDYARSSIVKYTNDFLYQFNKGNFGLREAVFTIPFINLSLDTRMVSGHPVTSEKITFDLEIGCIHSFWKYVDPFMTVQLMQGLARLPNILAVIDIEDACFAASFLPKEKI